MGVFQYRVPKRSLVFIFFLTLFFILSFSFPLRAETESRVDLGGAWDFYFDRENANNTRLFGDLLVRSQTFENEFLLDIGVGSFIGDKASNYTKVPQLYGRFGSEEQAHLVIGRYLHSWSHLDNYWKMGIIQPLFRWDIPLREEQGLPGIFFRTPLARGIELTVFGSYLFVPSQDPGYELEDGRFSSSNPWFKKPVEMFQFSNEQADLNYTIHTPEFSDVVFRPYYGIQLGTPAEKSGWLLNVFYLSKPRNDFITPFSGQFNLTTFRGDIMVHPVVARHNVYGLDFGWDFDRFKTIVSWLHESSVNYEVPADSTYPVIPNQDLFSFSQRIDLTYSQNLWLSYIKGIRKSNRIEGVFADTQIDDFFYRNLFEDTFQLRWEWLFFESLDRHQLKTDLSFYQSFVADHTWISVDVHWSVYKYMDLSAHCDFFGGYGSVPLGGDFISSYQNSDRCMVGGKYAF